MQPMSPVFPCASSDIACADPGGNGPAEVAKARVIFRPTVNMCMQFGAAWGLEYNANDAASVLLHEVGHTLGLDHSRLNGAGCSSGITDNDGGHAVMMTPNTFFVPTVRDWRRDDIEGLREIWSSIIAHSVYTWEDTAFPANPAELDREIVCADIRTPPALTSAVAEAGTSATQFMAFTDVDDRVSHLEWTGTEFAPPASVPVIVDPGPLGVSYGPVGIAHSDTANGSGGEVFVIWSAAEVQNASAVRLRWALRDITANSWTYGELDTPDGPTQGVKDVAVGYDPGTSQLIVTSITTEGHPWFVAVDLQGNQGNPLVLATGTETRPFAFDIGKANCYLDGETARCTIPYISSDFELNDPNFPMLLPGWYDLEVQADGTLTLVDDAPLPLSQQSELQPDGLADLASGPTGFRGVVGDRRYELARATGEGAADIPSLDTTEFSTHDWPLRIGSQLSATGGSIYRLATRRFGPRCGNGMLDCDEECDDGSIFDGDGCSAECLLEPDSTSGEPTTGSATNSTTMTTMVDSATATETGGQTGDDDCDCTTPERPQSTAFLLLLLLARRRPCASRR